MISYLVEVYFSIVNTNKITAIRLDGCYFTKSVNFLTIFVCQLIFAGWQDLYGIFGEENTFDGRNPLGNGLAINHFQSQLEELWTQQWITLYCCIQFACHHRFKRTSSCIHGNDLNIYPGP